ARQRYPRGMQPVLCERVTCGVGLGALVLVVREDEIDAAPMDVELATEVVRGHGGARQVPSRASVPPRGRPTGFAGLRLLPQCEIARIAFHVGNRFTLLHLVRPLSGERAVPVELTDREVHVATCRVRVTSVDQPLDQLDHLGDVSGGAWRDGGWQTAECVESGLEGPFVFGRPRPPGR